MSKTAISLLVHEQPSVFRDQIQNINHFFPGCYVVVHVSKSAEVSLEKFKDAASDFNNVIFNPTRIATRWGDLLGPKFSNMQFALKELPNVEYVAFAASNEMFVKTGVANHINGSAAGFHHNSLVGISSGSKMVDACLRDPEMRGMLTHFDASQVSWSQIEGTFYQRSLAEEMIDLIPRFFNTIACDAPYFREEFVFSTVANQLLNGNASNIRMPYTLKGLFAYDWARSLAAKNKAYSLPSRVLAKIIKWKYPSYWKVPTLRKCLRYEFQNLEYFSRIYGIEKFDPGSVYAIKQVQRTYDDPVRAYLRSLISSSKNSE